MVMSLLKILMGVIMPILDGILSPVLSPILEVVITMMQEFIQPLLMGGGGTFISQLLGMAMAIAQMVMLQIQALIAATVGAALKAMSSAVSGMAGKLANLSPPSPPMPGMPPAPPVPAGSLPAPPAEPGQPASPSPSPSAPVGAVSPTPIPVKQPPPGRESSPSPAPSASLSPAPSGSASASPPAPSTSPANDRAPVAEGEPVPGWFGRAPSTPLDDEIVSRQRPASEDQKASLLQRAAALLRSAGTRSSSSRGRASTAGRGEDEGDDIPHPDICLGGTCDGAAVLLQTGADPASHAAAAMAEHLVARKAEKEARKDPPPSENKGGGAPGGVSAKITEDVTPLIRDGLAEAALRFLPPQVVVMASASITESTTNVLGRWLAPRLHARFHRAMASPLRTRLSRTLSKGIARRIVADTHLALSRDLVQGLSRLLPLILAPATSELTNYRPERDYYCQICEATKGKGDLYCAWCPDPETGMTNAQMPQAQYYASFYGSYAAALHPTGVLPPGVEPKAK
ncbi:hypothetical protein FNF27_04656 [Cafeteria roenbergensis]|uniref:Uncharacterized protein n=2 Tax=Cafeteria roenbergensis TaxID=33653 RepID=A0A5A8ED80_CAFRO|nr:hypothetical protein FNF27_04656 [Cafeteria roenbergensis]